MVPHVDLWRFDRLPLSRWPPNDDAIDGASLAGIGFVVTFEMGKWARVYLDESLDAARVEAFEQLFPLAFAGFAKLEVAYKPEKADGSLGSAVEFGYDLKTNKTF